VFDAVVIACRQCALEMEKMAEIPWGPEWLECEMREMPFSGMFTDTVIR
jgi:hypothetical protein